MFTSYCKYFAITSQPFLLNFLCNKIYKKILNKIKKYMYLARLKSQDKYVEFLNSRFYYH